MTSKYWPKRDKAIQLWSSMRPHQWLKNVFILSGLIFGHFWNNARYILPVFLGIIAFSLTSSAGYIFNDLLDQKTDIKHPQKKYRPIAQGKITTYEAVLLIIILFSIGLGLGFYISFEAFVLLLSYCFLTIAYSIKLKNIPWIEMLCIVMGFILRILLGTLGVGISPSAWVICCGFLLASFLILAKRASEKNLFQNQGNYLRLVLNIYQKSSLDIAVYSTAFICFLAYVFYAIAHKFNLTIILVALGISHYLFLLRLRSSEGIELDISSELFQDKILQTIVFSWLLTLLWYNY